MITSNYLSAKAIMTGSSGERLRYLVTRFLVLEGKVPLDPIYTEAMDAVLYEMLGILSPPVLIFEEFGPEQTRAEEEALKTTKKNERSNHQKLS